MLPLRFIRVRNALDGYSSMIPTDQPDARTIWSKGQRAEEFTCIPDPENDDLIAEVIYTDIGTQDGAGHHDPPECRGIPSAPVCSH